MNSLNNSLSNSADPPNKEPLRYFVFDNLRHSQDQVGGNVYRFDRLEDAIACYERMPKEWTTALGGSRSDLSELDLVQRRLGVSTLVTDFNNFPEWRSDSQVQQAIGALVDRLGIGLMADRSIIKGPILIPLDERDPADDRYFSDKRLHVRSTSGPVSAINEAFVRGEGWVSPQRLSELSSAFGYSNPSCPFVTRLNVAYEADDGRFGQMDVTPREYGFLVEQTAEKTLAPQEIAAFAEHGTVNGLMEQVCQWKEAAALTNEREETFEQLTRKAKERAHEKNIDRSEKPASRSHDLEL